jgi:hypothetical protein
VVEGKGPDLVARRRQIYLVKTTGGPAPGSPSRPGVGGQGGGGAGSLVPLGTLDDLIRIMAGYNTSPDGSGPQGLGEALGMAILYGPGYTIEMPAGTDEVAQAIVTLLDEDFAWSVLGKMCKEQGWRMMDPETGRTFG